MLTTPAKLGFWHTGGRGWNAGMHQLSQARASAFAQQSSQLGQ